MPISIECPQCHQTYNVGDALAGKKVKCRQCGAFINVPSLEAESLIEPDLSGISDDAPPPPPPMKSGKGGRGGSAPRREETESFRTAREAPAPKKRRWKREPDSRTTRSIDSIINLVLWWALLGGIAVWVVHIAKSMGGIQASYLYPLGVVLVAGALVALLMTFAIKTTAQIMKFPPRDDTFNRCLLPVFLPLIASLLVGWPGLNSGLGSLLVTLAWIAAPILFIYFFRDEMVDWIASVVAGAAAVLVAWIIVGIVTGVAGGGTQQLYADMLPEGPWQKIATGHTPPPEAPKVAATQAAKPAVVTATQAAPGASTQTASTGPATGTTPVAATPTTSEKPPTSPTVAVQDDRTIPVAARSPFLTDIVADEAGLQDIREIIPGSLGSPWMLAVTGTDANVAVERWSLQPLAKKGSLSFSELPNQPNSYAITPRGDQLAAIVHFPKNQIQMMSFDNAQVHNVPLEDSRGFTPTILGFMDLTHFCVRWQLGNQTKLQIWYTGSGVPRPMRAISLEMAGALGNEVVLSPNGRWIGAFGRDPQTGAEQIVVYNSDNGQVSRRITPTTAMFRASGLAFSPDSMQIAMSATVSNVQSLLSFKIATGEPAYTGLLSSAATSPMPAHVSIDKNQTPGLLWLSNPSTWLVGGEDLIDATSGKAIGSLHLTDMLNEQLVGADSIILTQRTEGTSRRAIVAKIDAAKIKAATEKKE